MSKSFQFFISVLIFGLIGMQQVHAIDGDLSNPYATSPSPGGENAVIYDGNLDYGGKNAQIPFITLAGTAFLIMGICIVAMKVVKDKKHRPSM